MANVIPEKYQDLFQKKAFASLGTLMPDGRPQVTPVWVDFDGDHVMFNSAKGRQKDRNVRRDPRVELAIIDPANIPVRAQSILTQAPSILPRATVDGLLALRLPGAHSLGIRNP